MKGFNSEQYRDELAGKLKEIRKTEDFRSPEEKEAAEPSAENGPHTKMKAVLDEAKQTPEYLFSKEKKRFQSYKEKVVEFANEYFQDATIATEVVRPESEKDRLYALKAGLSKYNRSKFTDPNFPAAEAGVERLGDVISLSSPHVDLRLAKKSESILQEMEEQDFDDAYIYEQSTKNKYVLLSVLQPADNDMRVVLASNFLDEFPEYQRFVGDLPEKMNTLRSFEDEKGISISVRKLLRKMDFDREKVKDFLVQNVAGLNLSETPDPEVEVFVVARPEYTHAQHSEIAQTFADEQLVPEAGLNIEMAQKRENLLSRLSKAYELAKKKGASLNSEEVDSLVELCIEVAVRSRRWNQKNPPFVVVEGGGFMDILEDGTIALHGASQDFGREKDRNKTLAILESELPDTKFVIKGGNR